MTMTIEVIYPDDGEDNKAYDDYIHHEVYELLQGMKEQGELVEYALLQG